MKKNLFLILTLYMCCSLSLFGQKKDKVAPASKSDLTGLPLPQGSQQDKRGLSTYTAKILIEIESKKAGVGVKTPEVFVLPPVSAGHYNADSLVAGLQALGWAIQPVQGDAKYAWLQKDNRYLMAYFSMDKKETSLYLAEAAGIPAIPSASGTMVPPPGQGQPLPASSGIMPPPPGQGQPVMANQTNNNPGGSSGNPPVNPGMQNTSGMPVVTTGTNPTGNYVYNTTNFDDGWTSSIAEDKVIVAKGSLRVFIYFPIAYTDESRNAGRNWPWEHIISRDFNIRSTQYRDHGQVMSAFQSPYVEGMAIEKSSGQNAFIAMFALSSSGRMLITLAVAPDEQTIRNAFPKAEDNDASDLSAMRGYNRFAVDARDLPGTWSGSDGASVSYYDAYSGNFMGMNAASLSDKFVFGNGNTYSSVHNGGTGQVGNMRTFQQEFRGNYSADRWGMTLTNRFEGKTENFNCYFEAIRGGRILHLQNKQYTGTWYHVVKTN